MLIKYLDIDFEFSDTRGCIKQLVHENWKQVNYITSKAGVVRGNHYHKKNIELFYVISGEFELELKKISDTLSEKYLIKQGDFFQIDKNILHSFNFIKDTSLISMYSDGVQTSDGMDIYTE